MALRTPIAALRAADRLAATAVQGVRYSGGRAGCHARSAEGSGPVKPEGVCHSAFTIQAVSEAPLLASPHLTPWHHMLTAACRDVSHQSPSHQPQSSTPLQARYVQDLATHFEDGRLSDEIIATLDDAQLYDRLTAVKGVGPWTVHMFMMFTLGRWVCGPWGSASVCCSVCWACMPKPQFCRPKCLFS